ncbi:MAG: sugar (Glycoside-Pentoside-Hexuronide) transporter [Firmicutes bacterium]|nr:sugar (Glycoside-Pentoside-Hexuronide) transporter [Bacillota bacterium]
MGATISFQVIGMVVPLVVFVSNRPNGDRVSLVGIALAVIVLICYILCYKLTTERVHDAKMMSAFYGLGIIIMFMIVPMVIQLIKRLGVKEVAAGGLLFSAVMYLILFLLPITNVYLYLVLVFIAEFGKNFFLYTLWAMVNDVIDYHEYTTGIREVATIYSVYMFIGKLAQAYLHVVQMAYNVICFWYV